ncbi:MAG: hypothetical protein ACQETE_06200 [Bacteroidota bacterium]
MKYKTGEKFRRVADELFDGVIGDLARALDMKPESFSKYTSGRTHPGWKLLKRLLSIGVNVNWFLCDIPPMLIKDIPTSSNGIKELANSISESETQYMSSLIGEEVRRELSEEQWDEIGQFVRFLQDMKVSDSTKRRLLESFIADLLQPSATEGV